MLRAQVIGPQEQVGSYLSKGNTKASVIENVEESD